MEGEELIGLCRILECLVSRYYQLPLVYFQWVERRSAVKYPYYMQSTFSSEHIIIYPENLVRNLIWWLAMP